MTRTLQLGLLSVANLASLILFQWVLITSLGVGIESDALFAAMTVPQLFSSVIAISLTNVVAPMLAGEQSTDQRIDSWSLISITSIIFVGLMLVLIATAGWWTVWMMPGFTAEAHGLLQSYTRINLMVIGFTGFNAIQTGLAYARNQFSWVEASALFPNLIVIAIAISLVGPGKGDIASWLLVARAVLQSLFLLKITDRPVRPDFSRSFVKQAWQKMKPLLIGASYYKMDPLVDRFLLSSLPAGSLSLFYIAQQILSAGSQVAAKALATPAITTMANAYKIQDEKGFWNIYQRRLNILLVFAIVGLCMALVMGYLLLPFFPGIRNFTVSDAAQLLMLTALSGGMFIAGAIGSFTSGAFYARGDTITPTVIGVVTFTIAIFLKILLFKAFGLVGLAVGVSLYYGISLIAQLFLLHRERAKKNKAQQ